MRSAVLIGLAALLGVGPSKQAPADPCSVPERAGRQVRVRTIDELERAVDGARSGDTISLDDGRYRLRRMLDIRAADVTIRGRSSNATAVTLHGNGMTNDAVGVALSISASRVTVADLTIRDVGFHAVQVRGELGASRFTMIRTRLLDTGQQLFKVSTSDLHMYADDGLVACSSFAYTSHAPSNYTNGVDITAGKGWVVRDNRFERIRGPESDRWAAGPAILVWKSGEDTLVERNFIIDSFRGIALGLGPSNGQYARNGTKAHDHLRGVIRNNVVLNFNSWADEAIEANAAIGTRIEHNTVLVEGSIPWSIAVRFGGATADISNNLSNRQILERDGGRAMMRGNIASATREFFINPLAADLHLRAGTVAIDVGQPIPDIDSDFDRRPRIMGQAPDAGAFEFVPVKGGKWPR